MTADTTELSLDRRVGRRVAALQHDLLSDRQGRAHAAATQLLAVLRREDLSRLPSDPRVMGEIEMLSPPPDRLDSDDLSWDERAVYQALGLYAVHQQSRDTPVHVLGRSVGSATRQLGLLRSDDRELDPPVLRRFHAVGTATSHERRVGLLRALVTMFRSEGVPLDYGRLALDLRSLQHGRTAPGVLLRWGRDLYRNPPTTSQPSDTSRTETP